MVGTVEHWREQLAAWAIPESITAAVRDSPWTLPVGPFARRAERQLAQPTGVSWERAREALGVGGTVLDVGAGAGAASLPLPDVTGLTAVDTSQSMLDDLAGRAAALERPVHTVLGRWPDVAASVPTADVVVCHHVVYNVPDLAAFALALSGHARRRVVVELTALHPMAPLNPLWTVMHGLVRPSGPTADDAAAVLRSVGLEPVVERWPRPAPVPHPSFAEMVEVTGRRLCLPPERRDELAAALVDLGVDPAQPRDLAAPDDRLVTLWWDR
jgi:hypothetical protein